MRNILLTAILIFLCSQIAYADTAYYPPYPVPIPCAQGGTGLTSGTTNNVLAFTGSCTIGGTVSILI